MKRSILIALVSMSLASSACNVDRGTTLTMPFFSVFGGNTATMNTFAINGVQAVINGSDITLTLPCDATLDELAASFEITGVRVEVNGVEQVNGVTRNDFSNPVVYTVYSRKGSSKSYNVYATIANYSEKAITQFSINNVNATISGTSIHLVLPDNTDISSLVPAFTTTGRLVTINGTEQKSGETRIDFTSQKTYTVEACDGSTLDYTVTVAVADSNAKEISDFFVNGNRAAIEGTNITLEVPCATDRSSMVVTYSTTGQTVTVNGVEQVSGGTMNFNTSKIYRVTAANGTTQDYTVAVTLSSDDNHSFMSFSINGVNGTIDNNNHTIGIELSCGTDRTRLVPLFTAEGRRVYVGVTEQQSGTTENNFTSPGGVTYRVEACDGSITEFVVTVTLAGGNSNRITSFSFDSVSGESVIIDDDAGTIDVQVPCLTGRSNLVATFSTTGNRVITAETGVQESGVTINDFTNPIVYTVRACDDTERQYTVTVTPTGCDNKDITGFSLFGRDSDPITGTTITITVPNWADLSHLTPTIAITGSSVSPASGEAVNFSATNPQTFTVTSVDGNSTKDYYVTVDVSPAFLMAGTYAAGYYHDGTNNIACLWDLTDPGGHRVDLTDNSAGSRAASVSVLGDTVYVVGTYNGNACFWKISDSDTTAPSPVELDSTGDDSVVDSVIAGDYLYISGTYDIAGAHEACYWMVDLATVGNPAVRQPLANGTGGDAYEMTQSGGGIYIAGTVPDSAFGYERPCFWSFTPGTVPVPGSREIVYNDRSFGRTVMIYGSYRIIGGWWVYNSSYTQARSWSYINTMVPGSYLMPEMQVPNSSIVSSSLYVSRTGIPESGNRYIVGQRESRACYWLNNNYGAFLDSSNPSNAYGISEVNSILYIPGYYTNTGVPSACVWTKSGSVITRIPLDPTAATESAARDVFVKN